MARPSSDLETVLSVDDQETEELVAYLDNELDPEQRRRVEERLAHDDQFRRRLHELEQAWEMLEWLPRSQASPEFVRTTVEIVAVRTEQDLGQAERRAWRIKWLRNAVVAATLCAALGAGYSVMRWRQQAREREFLADLPLVQDLNLYRVADRVEFVRELHQHGLFADAPEDGDEPETPGSD